MRQEYTYYNVEVEPMFGSGQYSYLADTDYCIGDYVMVPFGRKQLLGIVSEIRHCTEADAPYPPEKTKKILRSATDDEIRGEPEPGEEIDNTDDSSWTEEEPPCVRCYGKIVAVTPLELKIIRWIAADPSPRPLRNVQRRYPKYTPNEVADALEHLKNLGFFYGGKNFVGNTYFPQDGISIRN